MRKSVRKLIAISEKTKAATPVEINGRKHYVDLRFCHYEYLLATYHDGSVGIYLCCPDGSIKKDDCSLIENLRDVV